MDMNSLVSIVIYLLIIGGVCWLLLFIVAKVGPPEPFGKIATIIIYVVAALACINLLLSLGTGTPYIRFR